LSIENYQNSYNVTRASPHFGSDWKVTAAAMMTKTALVGGALVGAKFLYLHFYRQFQSLKDEEPLQQLSEPGRGYNMFLF